ncbi:ParB/RepB/Spo0J family partition protein [Endothiovibrio diazotrophicus]
MSAVIESIPVDAIRVGKRMRHVVENRVEKLAESIRALGVQVPVSVIGDGGGYTLVAGLHRLEACKRLGLERVPCIAMAGGEVEALLWEVDENLMRSELSPIERAAHLKRRKELWERKLGAVGEGEEEARPDFADETAGITGESKAAINRDLRRAASIEEVGYTAEHLAGTILDKGCELDALRRMEAGERRALIEQAVAGETVTARMPRPPLSPEQEVDRLIRAFEQLAQRLEGEQRVALAREVLNTMSEEERRQVLVEYA